MVPSGILNAACKSPALGETFAGGVYYGRPAIVNLMDQDFFYKLNYYITKKYKFTICRRNLENFTVF